MVQDTLIELSPRLDEVLSGLYFSRLLLNPVTSASLHSYESLINILHTNLCLSFCLQRTQPEERPHREGDI